MSGASICLQHCEGPKSLPSPPLFSSPLPLEVGLLNPARGLGERCKLPSGVWGEAPAANDFGAFSGWRNAAGGIQFKKHGLKHQQFSTQCRKVIDKNLWDADIRYRFCRRSSPRGKTWLLCCRVAWNRSLCLECWSYKTDVQSTYGLPVTEHWTNSRDIPVHPPRIDRSAYARIGPTALRSPAHRITFHFVNS